MLTQIIYSSILVLAYAAVFPVPGSYYSLLLKFNSKPSPRKGPRLAPAPHRLWAYFDPPATLGSLYPHEIHNEIRSKREKYKFRASPRKRLPLPKARSPVASIPKKVPVKRSRIADDYKQKPSYFPSTCNEVYDMKLKPGHTKPDKKGRIFYKEFGSIGYPYTYPKEKQCQWIVNIDSHCQMGMIVHEMKGNILPSTDCTSDYVSVTYDNKERQRLCGPIDNTVSHKWTASKSRQLILTMKTDFRNTTLPVDHKWGIHVKLSGYCWVFSRSYHHKTKLLKQQKTQKPTVGSPFIEILGVTSNSVSLIRPSTSTIKSVDPTLITFSPFNGI